MPSKRRLVTSEICFGTEKAGLLDFSYNKCAQEKSAMLKKSKMILHGSEPYSVRALTFDQKSKSEFFFLDNLEPVCKLDF